MKPTAKNKMRDVDEILTSLSMLPALFQSRVLPLDKPRSLFHNLNITANLLRELKQLGDATTVANSLLWENVSPSTISSFLRNYRLPEGNRGRTLPWITDQTENCPDDSWSVCLVGTRSSTRRAPFEHLKVGEDIKALEFGMPIRGRFPNSNSIGTVPGSFDFAIDLMHAGYHRNQFSTLSGGFSYTKMWAIRNHNNPILLIYVVDRNSDPTSMRTRGAKQPLFSADGPRIDTVALAIAYPGEHTNGHNSEYYIRSGAEPFPGGE
jgi:hypothetical protein